MVVHKLNSVGVAIVLGKVNATILYTSIDCEDFVFLDVIYDDCIISEKDAVANLHLVNRLCIIAIYGIDGHSKSAIFPVEIGGRE